ncbi:hypothetical protein, partial [Salmonella sp. SAL4357]|uniref:hypothetical protein n=1 Tax=Salmonella sp. SAL4357 TaxID=3159878 RepID=UPI0039793EBA
PFNDPSGVIDQGAAYAITLGPFAWTGAINSDFHTPGNWDPPVVPGPNDDVIIPADGGTIDPIINTSDAAIRSLAISTGRTLA